MTLNEEAGFWIRLGAALLDGLIIGVPLLILSWIIGGKEGQISSNLLSALYSFFLPILWNGYTIGKRICGIRIRRVHDHSPPGFGTMLLRDIVAGIVYGLTFGIGIIVSGLMVMIREDKRSLHDFIAGTEVVYD